MAKNVAKCTFRFGKLYDSFSRLYYLCRICETLLSCNKKQNIKRISETKQGATATGPPCIHYHFSLIDS